MSSEQISYGARADINAAKTKARHAEEQAAREAQKATRARKGSKNVRHMQMLDRRTEPGEPSSNGHTSITTEQTATTTERAPSVAEVRSIPIDDVVLTDHARKDLGAIDDLAASIRNDGLLHPIVVDEENRLIAGHRRHEACKQLGWGTIPARVMSFDDGGGLRAQLDENIVRKPLLVSECLAIAEQIESRVQAKAKERQGTRTDKHPGKLPGSSKGNARDHIARMIGMSGRTYDKARAVSQAAEEDPETFGDLVAVMDEKVDRAYRALRLRREAQAAATDDSNPEEANEEILRARERHNVVSALKACSKLLRFDPEHVADVADPVTVETIERVEHDLVEWFSRFTQSRSPDPAQDSSVSGA